MRLRIISVMMWLICLSAMCSSCRQRELCYDHSHYSPVSVVFDWSRCPDAEPATMVVWFFPAEGGAGRRYEIIPGGDTSRGGSEFNTVLKVAPGSYRVICHNGETENNLEDGDTFFSYRIHTGDDVLLSPMNRSDNAPCPDGCDTQPVKTEASTLYAHTYPSVVSVAARAGTPVEVRFVPEEVTCVWNVTITGIENLVPGVEASGVVTGAAECWSHADEAASGEDVMVPFPLSQYGGDCLKGKVTLFGVNERDDMPHKLRVYTSYKYYYDFDITDQVRNAPDSHHIEIMLHGIKLPDPQGGNGMSPGVSDWGDTEDVEIKM